MTAFLSALLVAFVAAVVATPPPSKMATPPRVAAGGKVSLAKARGVICALMFVVAFGAVVVAPVAHAAKNYDFLCLSYDDWSAWFAKQPEGTHLSHEKLFTEIINDKLAEGWSLQGGISAFSYTTRTQYSGIIKYTYCQAFIK